MTRFADQNVIVTGGGRGLGREAAIAFAREGAHVFVGYQKREKDANATAESICEAGGSAQPFCCDVTDRAACKRAIASAKERGRIDVLVNSAGVVRNQVFALSSEADWEDPIRVNLGGALQITRAVLPSMLAAGGGAIVHIGSVAGVRASPGQAGYSASKGGLIAMVRTLGAELAPRGIRVNAVIPGLCDVGMAARLDRSAVAGHLDRIPLGRRGTAAEIANVTLFLASQAASYIVGQSLVVDGGMTL